MPAADFLKGKDGRSQVHRRRRRPRWLGSKWVKTKVLLRNSKIKPHIPDTRIFNRTTLKSMLGAYRMVYVKPVRGTQGKGVIKVERTGKDFRYQEAIKEYVFPNFKEMLASLKRETGTKRYLVQKGIPLLKYRGRRFDIRVMIQKNLKRRWEATGIVGRLGHPRKIVTNFHNGGKPMPIDTLLDPSLKPLQIRKLKKRLKRLGLKVARQIGTKCPAVDAVGMDIGLDQSAYPNILEVNMRPDTLIFNALRDKRMYRKVRKYAIANRRLK